MGYIAIKIKDNDDYINLIQKEKLFTEMVMDFGIVNNNYYLYIINKTIFERLRKISKMTNRNIGRFEMLSEIINKYSFATINNNWEWTIGKYETIK
jgi:hypothetical protein